jgi:hypothetical protein
LCATFRFGCLTSYRDKKVVGVFVRFRAPSPKALSRLTFTISVVKSDFA